MRQRFKEDEGDCLLQIAGVGDRQSFRITRRRDSATESIFAEAGAAHQAALHWRRAQAWTYGAGP